VSFFSLFSFFLSFVPFRHFALPHLVERVLAQLTEKDREAHKAQEAARFERERERSFCPSFFFFLQKRALYSIYIKSIYTSQK